MHKSPSLKKEKSIVNGIAWLITLSWINRLLGFFSIIILARLLSPEDFGVMAVVVIAIQLVETLTNIGSEQYFIQKKNTTIKDLNCAWTSNVIIKLIASIVFAVVSPFIAQAFNYPQLIPALITISILPFITSLTNGWIIQLKKDLNYKHFVISATLAKLIANISSVLIAFYLMNYWALIIGAILNALLYTIFSYLFIKPRAYWGLHHWQQQFQFSKWVILKSLVGHVRAKFDVWFASTVQGISALGGYNFSKDLVLLPSRELLSPMSEVFFTAIAKTKNGSNDQKIKIIKAITVIYIIGIPISFGWGIIAEPFTQVVLGKKWLPYVSTIAALGFLVFTFSVGNFISYVMTATGHVKALFYYDTITLILALSTLFLIVDNISNVTELAFYRIIIGFIILGVGFLWLKFYDIISPLTIIKPAIYPSIISWLMIYFAGQLTTYIQTPALLLILTIVISGIFFCVALFIGCKLNLLGKVGSYFVIDLVKQNSKSLFKNIIQLKKHEKQ